MALIDTEDLRKRYLFHAKVRAEEEINQIIREIKKYDSSNDRQDECKMKYEDIRSLLKDYIMNRYDIRPSLAEKTVEEMFKKGIEFISKEE